VDYRLIREIETTTASLHGSQVDLSVEGEFVLRDLGYFGVGAKGIDFKMRRRTMEKPLEEIDKQRNRLVSRLRSPGERPFLVMKKVFRAATVLVTTFKRVSVKMIVYSLCVQPASVMHTEKCRIDLDLRMPGKIIQIS
jgi:transposase, IS5 family